MAWRVCKVPGCRSKPKPVQPWGTNERRPWLCNYHRMQARQKTLDHLARVANVKLLTKLFTSR